MPVAVRGWRSRFSGAQYLSLWTSATELAPAGTVTSVGCEQNPATGAWAYSAWEPDAGWSFPADDGTGRPLAKFLAPNQPAFVYVLSSNLSSSAILGNAAIDVEALPLDAGVTQTESLVHYNANISLPPTSTRSISATCPLPSGAKFSRFTVFTHNRSINTQVRDGVVTLLNSNDFEHPLTSTYGPPSFYAPTGSLTTECTYNNTEGRTVTTGFSYTSDEQCMMFSYFFPTNRNRLCVNNQLIP